MPHVRNMTPFGVDCRPGVDRQGQDLLVICVAGRFELPPAGQAWREPLKVSDRQQPPPMEDVYWGEPGRSSLRHEGQSAYCRPGTDVYVTGQAWAPRGRAVREVGVGVQVGPCRKLIQVFGERTWSRGLLGMRASEPRPFESMPLRWERSVGGAAHEPRNPVGCGLHASAREAEGQPLPNLEDPARLLESPTDRGVEPVGLGPIARSWQPRLALAGTYDEAWKRQRAPLWPLDFDERFFQAAAPGLNVARGLQGGEAVVLSGLSPAGSQSFSLPGYRLMVRSHFQRRLDRRRLVLDAVHLDTEERQVLLCWRAAVPCPLELTEHEYCVVRELEPWEEWP